MPIAYYTRRLLNPFRGVINCIRYESAEAVTLDGRGLPARAARHAPSG